MSGTYLPGDTRQRIQDLIKDSSITQAELAGIIGLSESAFSRYLKGQTEMLGDGYVSLCRYSCGRAGSSRSSRNWPR